MLPLLLAALVPLQLAHYYPWYPEHCQSSNWTHYQPWLGCYNSSEQSTINLHIGWARYAGLDGFISSWWGPGSPEDVRLQQLLDSGFKWTIHYEMEGYSDPSWSKIRSDLRYLRKYFNHPNWLKVDGKPVVFVYGPAVGNTSSRWKTGVQLSGTNVYYLLQAYDGFRTDPFQPSSWHTYELDTRLVTRAPYSSVVSPGFWDYREERPKLEQNLSEFEAALGAMISQGMPWQIVGTWNEWHESTSVEPSSSWSDPAMYLRAMCRQFKGVGC